MRLRAGAGKRSFLPDAIVARNVTEASRDAFVETSGDGVIECWNAAAEVLFGLSCEEILGRRVDSLVRKGQLSPPGPDGLAEVLHHPPGGFERRDVRAVATVAGGRLVPVEVSVMQCAGAAGWSVRAFVRDVSGLVRLERSCGLDPLTKLPGAPELQTMIAEALAHDQEQGRLVAVCHVALDRTQLVNDALGHEAGDELIVTAAQRLASATRRPKSIARYGGDELVVVVGGLAGVEDAIQLASRLVRVLSVPVLLAQHEVVPSASVGVALADPSRHEAPSTALAQAVVATRRAKARGGASFEVFDRSAASAAASELELEGELRRAVEHDELRLSYQPVLRPNGDLWGYEALVRWQHPTRGLVAPSEFLMIAEDSGLVVAIGEWVLRRAARQLVIWRRLLPCLRLAVNVSPRQLSAPGLARTTAEILEEEGLPADALSCEVTEPALLGAPAMAAAALGALAGTGVSITLDGFGVGCASLLYLRRFPIDTVKLDRYLLAGLARDAAVLGTVVQLAHALGTRVGAVGVETHADLELVRSIGCDLLQGHLVSPPRAAAELPPPSARWQLGADGETGPDLREPPDGEGNGASRTGVDGSRSGVAPATPRSAGGPSRRIVLVEAAGEERERRRSALEAAGRVEVVGLTSSPDEAIGVAARCAADAIVVDLSLTGDFGMHLLPEITRRAPRSLVVVRCSLRTPAVSRALLASGADACVAAGAPTEELIAALEDLSPLEWPRVPMPELRVGGRGLPGLLEAPVRSAEVLEPARRFSEYLELALAGDHRGAVAMVCGLRRAGAEFEAIVGDLLGAAVAEVGRRSVRGEVSHAEAASATAVTSSVLEALGALSSEVAPVGRLALALPRGEVHVLAGRLVGEELRQRGWQVSEVGQVSAVELSTLLSAHRYDALLLSCTMPVLLDSVLAGIEAAHEHGTRVLVGGAAFGPSPLRAERLGADGWAPDARQAARLLSGWRGKVFHAAQLRRRLPVAGGRAPALAARAASLALVARAGLDEALAGLVEIALRGAVSALLTGDETLITTVAAQLLGELDGSAPSRDDLVAAIGTSRAQLAGYGADGELARELDELLSCMALEPELDEQVEGGARTASRRA